MGSVPQLVKNSLYLASCMYTVEPHYLEVKKYFEIAGVQDSTIARVQDSSR